MSGILSGLLLAAVLLASPWIRVEHAGGGGPCYPTAMGAYEIEATTWQNALVVAVDFGMALVNAGGRLYWRNQPEMDWVEIPRIREGYFRIPDGKIENTLAAGPGPILYSGYADRPLTVTADRGATWYRGNFVQLGKDVPQRTMTGIPDAARSNRIVASRRDGARAVAGLYIQGGAGFLTEDAGHLWRGFNRLHEIPAILDWPEPGDILWLSDREQRQLELTDASGEEARWTSNLGGGADCRQALRLRDADALIGSARLWALTDTGLILTTANLGQSWAQLPPLPDGPFEEQVSRNAPVVVRDLSVDGQDGDRLWIVDGRGNLWRFQMASP